MALFAEGNRSFDGVTGPIAEATGKMAKAAGVPVVTFRFEGGFLTQPRFSTDVRKGRMYGRLVHVYSREELAAMSEEDVNKAIAADLHEDAYEAQKRERITYKGKKKKLAYGLESTLCRCIRCGEFGTLRSDRDTIRCDRCGSLLAEGAEGGKYGCCDGCCFHFFFSPLSFGWSSSTGRTRMRCSLSVPLSVRPVTRQVNRCPSKFADT